MNKFLCKREANKVMDIVSTGNLKIKGTNKDISEELSKHESIEYREEDINKINLDKFNNSDKACKFTVLSDGSDELVFNQRYKGKKICILNFASSKNPGGGFLSGSIAQEEALCQSSNLYSILKEHEEFYEENRADIDKSLYKDGIIYTKDCLFFRKKYENVEPEFADVITCPAPNRGAALLKGVKEDVIDMTMSRRIEQILKVAIANNVKILALGAFGCGVFRNNPEKVANIMRTIIFIRGYCDYFEEIIFPMNEVSGEKYKIFSKAFNRLS